MPLDLVAFACEPNTKGRQVDDKANSEDMKAGGVWGAAPPKC